VSFKDVWAFLFILGLPTLLVVAWIGLGVFLRRIPLWFLAVAGGVSAVFILLAWVMSMGADTSGAGGEGSVIRFYGMFLNGSIGLLTVVVLGIATAVIEWIRWALGSKASHEVPAGETGEPPIHN
jgi:hypothetical protein